MLQAIADLLLVDHVRHLRCIAKEVEILSNLARVAESVLVESILLIVQLVAQTIVGILEINAGRGKLRISNYGEGKKRAT